MQSDSVTTKNKEQVDNAEPRKPARRILAQEISEGLGELNRSATGLLIAGLSAGLDVGFSLLLIAIMWTRAKDVVSEPVFELLIASMYAIGFIFVVIGRSELFTEHTTLAVLPVLNGRASLASLGRLWGLVYVSNIVGAAAFAGLVVAIGPALGIIEVTVLGEIASSFVDHAWWVILVSGILAGWLMGLLSWLVAAGRDTISQIVIVWLITAAIGFSHLHHSIVGTAEVLAGLFAGQGITWGDFFHFLVWATVGNSIGGGFFVAVIKYSHVIRSSEGQEPDELDSE